jgi:hypothetical protein
MLKISLTVERRDGNSVELAVYPPAIINFERWAKCGISSAFAGTDVRMEHLYYLAWLADKDNGNVVKPFEEWAKNVADVEISNDPKV